MTVGAMAERGRGMGPGERAERAKRRRLWWAVGVLALTGAVTGFIVGYTEGEQGFMQGTLPAPVAIGLTVLLLGAILIGGPIMMRNLDEHERAEHMQFSNWGAGTFLLVYPAWFLLWKGRLLPEPHHLLLFILFYAGGVLGYTASRYRSRRATQGD